MARITGLYPDYLDLLIEGAVEAGVFVGKSDALGEFAREYFENHENKRIATGSEIIQDISELKSGLI